MQNKTYKQLRKELLKDKKIKQFYERLESEFAVIEMIIRKRIESGLSQKNLPEELARNNQQFPGSNQKLITPAFLFCRK